MDGETKRRDLQSLLESIRATEVLEIRASLISQIGDSYQTDTSDAALLIECLVTFWEDSTCFSISRCTLNREILSVAAKYLEAGVSNCISQFLVLGTKAIIWCRKHFQVSFVSAEMAGDSEQSNLLCQLILDTLSFSAAGLSTLTHSPNLLENMLMLHVENFVSELLKLTKALILELKRIHFIASDVLKATQVVLDAAIKLCRAYFQTSRHDKIEMSINRSGGSQDDDVEVDCATHIVTVTASTIETLFELGIFAASGGGNLVTLLNMSWKGVVCLLQLNKGALAERVNIGNIILTLISLATENLRCAAEGWFSTIKEGPTVSEAKRTFLPIKFYLINAVRISSEFSCKSVNIYREICRCVLLISSLGISLSKETHLRAASEALIEFVEPISFLLLHALLNSADVKFESKTQIIECLFVHAMNSGTMELETDIESPTDPFARIFAVDCDAMLKSKVLMLGRIVLFVNLLKSSSSLKDEMVYEISTKLGIFMNALIHEDVYSSILGVYMPVFCATGSTPGVTWQPMYSCILHSLKTFLIVASPCQLAWIELEMFLFENLLHPHFLCLDIVRELLSFVMRHTEMDVANDILGRLSMLFKVIASLEPALCPHSSLRKMARSICCLLTDAVSWAVDHVYTSITNDAESYLSSVMLIALLLEGFPFNLLSDDLKVLAIQKIVTAFYGFIESNLKELRLNVSSGISDLVGLPVHALSSTLRSGKIKSSEVIDEKNTRQVLQFGISLLHGFRTAAASMKGHYAKVFAATLDVISSLKQPHISDEMRELILELQALFVASSHSDSMLYRCRLSLVSFMVSLSHLEIPDGEGSELYAAFLSLYHALLRERHWAFNHLAMGAFANFAACTSCSELWRFIPDDAALSFDTCTGKEAEEARFMTELKSYLEKEVALQEVTLCKDQLHDLVIEGLSLRRTSNLPGKASDTSEPGTMSITNVEHENKKKRKLPDGVCEGMELLQSGLKAMDNALAHAETAELKDLFLPHISSLKDVISHLAGLSDSVTLEGPQD